MSNLIPSSRNINNLVIIFITSVMSSILSLRHEIEKTNLNEKVFVDSQIRNPYSMRLLSGL